MKKFGWEIIVGPIMLAIMIGLLMLASIEFHQEWPHMETFWVIIFFACVALAVLLIAAHSAGIKKGTGRLADSDMFKEGPIMEFERVTVCKVTLESRFKKDKAVFVSSDNMKDFQNKGNCHVYSEKFVERKK